MAQPRPRPTSMAQQQGSSRPVSSFYGGGGGGGGPALNNRDSYISTGNRSSMFFNGQDSPRRSPSGMSGAGQGNRDGQQRDSYYSQIAQRQEDYSQNYYDPYNQHQQQQSSLSPAHTPDIYGDFNNMAPKVANRLDSYDKSSPTGLETHSPLLEKGNHMSMAGGELVPAPSLGNDWNPEESRRSKVITEKPQSGSGLFKGWGKSIRKAFRWRTFIFILFGFLCCLAVLLYFIVPRVPTFELSADEPLTVDEKNVTFTRSPAIFNWNGQMNIAVDGKSNWIPFHFTSFSVNLYDLNTGKQVARGDFADGRHTFPGRKLTPAELDVRFFYRGNNDSDTTWKDFYNACAHKYTTIDRPGLDFTVEIKMDIRGLIGTKTAGTIINGLECPFELPANNA